MAGILPTVSLSELRERTGRNTHGAIYGTANSLSDVHAEPVEVNTRPSAPVTAQ